MKNNVNQQIKPINQNYLNNILYEKEHFPHKRLFLRGPQSLSDFELIAILLGSGTTKPSTIHLAHYLLKRFGTLSQLFDTTSNTLNKIKGINSAKTAIIVTTIELTKRVLSERVHAKPIIDSPLAVENHLKLTIGSRPQEILVCLFLDARNRLIQMEESAQGSITHITIYPREIIKRALSLNACSLIIAHNHPSGKTQPSQEDKDMTEKLKYALSFVDIRLLDHLIIGTEGSFSFANNGIL